MLDRIKKSEQMKLQQQANPWLFRFFSLFLLAQAFTLTYIATSGLATIRWEAAITSAALEEEMIGRAFTYLTFLLLAIPLLPAAIGIFFRLQAAWLLTMLSQALTLSFCLYLYFNWRPPIIYPIMLFCIIMVLYFNSTPIRIHFDNPILLTEPEKHGER